MKRFFTVALFAIATICGLNAQTEELKEWLKKPSGELLEQKFAKKKIDKNSVKEVTAIIDSLWRIKNAERLQSSWQRLTIYNDSLRLACACRDFGRTPADGRSLFISMHGGGECPKEVNDEQWMNQIYLYEPKEGLYIAPRAPWNSWDLWHKKGIDKLFEDLITACIIFENVNPDKVYLMGYSAGGDGVWRMAPRMADHWAAASMMAGHPGGTSQVNLRNLPFMIWMGEFDSAYNRNNLAIEKGEVMDKLQANDPEGYIHSTNIIEGKGHWMDLADSEAIPWMTQYRRNPYPEKIVWRQELVTRNSFYWLAVPEREAAHGKELIVERKGNEIHINKSHYSHVTIYLNDEMMDLDKPVKIYYKGKRIGKKRVKRNIANIYESLNERNDPRYAFPAKIELHL